MDTEVAGEDVDLNGLWIAAQAEFKRITKQNDVKVLSVNEVLQKIKLKGQSDEQAMKKYDKAQNIVKATLVCVENLGAVAAQLGSLAFAPSQTCFNAVSFLFDVARNVSKIFNGVIALFGRISVVLDQVEVHLRSQDLVDVKLKRIAYRIILSFMSICNMSIRISQENKFLLVAKVFLFNSDEGVQAELDQLERLVADETGMSIALIHESAMKTEKATITLLEESREAFKIVNGKIDGLSEDVTSISNILERQDNTSKRKEREELARKQQDTIREALFGKDGPKEEWSKQQGELLSLKTKDTGNWLLEITDYRMWADRESSTPILVITAPEGYGKTYTCSSAIQDLNQRYPIAQVSHRVAVAYYFLQVSRSNDAMNALFRSLVWQLSNADAAYQKSVASACEYPEEFNDTEVLWQKLVLDFANTDATFFLVIDGIDDSQFAKGKFLTSMLRDISTLLSEKGNLSIRVLLTVRPKALNVLEALSDIPIGTIHITPNNTGDVEKYINSRLDDMDVFRQIGDEEIRQLRERALSTLVEKTHGDFLKINYTLEDLKTTTRRKGIEELLERAGEDRSEMIARELTRLSASLNAEDISDLNEILIWVLGGLYGTCLEYLEVVLLRKNGERTLIPIEDQIRSKYDAVLNVDDTRVLLRSDSFRSYFEELHEKSEIDDIESAKISAVEVKIIKRFLRQVCDQELFDKFGFDDFFRSKLTTTNMKIQVPYGNDLDMLMVLKILDIILDDQDEKYGALMKHALMWVKDYLERVDLAIADGKSKIAAGEKIAQLFYSESEILKFCEYDLVLWACSRYAWDPSTDAVLRWLKDPVVVKNISGPQKEWINKITSASPNDDDVLGPMAKTFAKRWLQTTNETGLEYFNFINAIVYKLRHRKDPSQPFKAKYHDKPYGFPSQEEIEELLEKVLDAEKWCKVRLNVNEPNSLWNTKLGSTCLELGINLEAKKRSQVAHEQDSDNWRALLNHSKACAELNQPEEAIESLERIHKMFKAQGKLVEKHKDLFYTDILTPLGAYNEILGHYDIAVSIYNNIYEEEGDKYKTVTRLLGALIKQRQYLEVAKILMDSKEQVGDNGHTQFINIFKENAPDKDFKYCMHKLADDEACFDIVKEGIEKAMVVAVEVEWPYSLLYLRNLYGEILSASSKSREDHERAIQIWEENIKLWPLLSPNPLVANIYIPSLENLGMAYLQYAKSTDLNPAIVETYSSKLAELSFPDLHRKFNCYDIEFCLIRLYYLAAQKAKERQEADSWINKTRELLKGHIQIALNILSDSLAENVDPDGYLSLAQCFIIIGAEDLVAAAWRLAISGKRACMPKTGSVEEERITEKAHSTIQLREDGTTGSNTPVLSSKGANEDSDSEAHRVDNSPGSASNEETEVNIDIGDIQDGIEETFSNNDENSEDDEAVVEYEYCTGTYKWFCSYCKKIFDGKSDIYICADFPTITLDSGCKANLDAGTFDDRPYWYKGSPYLYLPATTEEEWAAIPWGSVKIGEELLEVEDWLETIKAEWGYKPETREAQMQALIDRYGW